MTRRQRRAGRKPGPATTMPKPRGWFASWLGMWESIGRCERRRAVAEHYRGRPPGRAFMTMAMIAAAVS